MKRNIIAVLLSLAAIAGAIWVMWRVSENETAPLPALSEEYIAPEPTPALTPAPTPAPTPKPVEPEPQEQLTRETEWTRDAVIDPAWAEVEGDNFSEILSRLLFQYEMTEEAACGVISNMWFESGYRPDIGSVDGSYGLCQWLGCRRMRLYDWCAANGFSADTVEGQLAYLDHELDIYAVDLTGTAYECAESFCRVYEAPGNISTQARLRGNYADELYGRFFAE